MANAMQKYRVCVIEDDPDVALYRKTVLEKRADAIVLAITNPSTALEGIAEFEPDMVIAGWASRARRASARRSPCGSRSRGV
jgi:PleD family two-component response regulator